MNFVMPGLVPGIHVLLTVKRESWMAGQKGVYARLRGLCAAMTDAG